MSFFDRHHGLVMGDPVGGKFQILATEDGGRSWTRFDARSFDSVECVQTGACWASGAGGAAARLVVGR